MWLLFGSICGKKKKKAGLAFSVCSEVLLVTQPKANAGDIIMVGLWTECKAWELKVHCLGIL